MKKKAKITLVDISNETGLSVTTVSRALRGDATISPSNEKTILEAAQRLGYPILQRNTPVDFKLEIYVAFLSEFYKGEFFSMLTNAFANFPNYPSVRVVCYNMLETGRSVREVVQEFVRNDFSALIVFLPKVLNPEYSAILKELPPGFPIISIAPMSNPVLPTIYFDSYGGGHIVGEHFAERNYKKVGIIKGSAKAHEAKQRTNGFMDFVNSQSEMEMIWSFQGDYTPESGVMAYHDFKNAPEKPRAIFAANDTMALSFINAALEDGVKIPDDVAIVGFDNVQMGSFQYPSLSTINPDYRKLAEETVAWIMASLENRPLSHGQTSLIPVSLVIRRSS